MSSLSVGRIGEQGRQQLLGRFCGIIDQESSSFCLDSSLADLLRVKITTIARSKAVRVAMAQLTTQP